MKALLLAFSLLVTVPSFAQSVPCRQAMEKDLRNYVGPTNTLQFLTMQIIPVGDEHLFEVTSLVLSDNPKADTLSAYYWMVSATCQAKPGATNTSDVNNFILSQDMPGEGGLISKLVTKLRY